MNTDEELHYLAREIAKTLKTPDRKQLQFNEIVQTAKDFYSGSPRAGVIELVQACDRSSPLYVNKKPMWKELQISYQWMK